MLDVFNPNAAARQVELAVAQLDCLSTLPCVGAQILSRLQPGKLSPAAISDIIRADPALSAKCLSLVCRRGRNVKEGKFSLQSALENLPVADVCDAILSVKAIRPFEPDYNDGGSTVAFKKDLQLHTLAVACCAKHIAKAALPEMDPELAYYAGLLHDIGKLALREVMPKSTARIVAEAETTGESSLSVEQRNLGLDHTIVGEHLAQQWRLPNAIMLAVWLHHSDTVMISREMPQARIAVIVQLADSIARQLNIGHSGSFDRPYAPEPLAEELRISIESLDRIRESLSAEVSEKSEILDLDSQNAMVDYCRAAHDAAVRFSREWSELSAENQRLQSSASHLDFTTGFLIGTSPAVGTANIAEDFAVRWQRFYQTGKVCLYVAPSIIPDSIEAVVVESLSQSSIVLLNVSDRDPVVPRAIESNFSVLNAHDHISWLLEQLDAEFDEKRTKLVPLLCEGRAVGAIAFEIHYPGDAELFEQKFKISASLAGSVLGMAISRQKQQYFAERFVRLVSQSKQMPTPQTEQPASPAESEGADDSLIALAEMAAGAAHELNNPLAVISGRAQLLAEAEGDVEQREILKQIWENAREASGIIEDLMSFAEPPHPRIATTDVPKMLDEAVQLAGRKTNGKELDVRIEIADDIASIFVDSAQIVSAIANVVSNAAESYGDQIGPIIITARNDETGETIRLSIRDEGCGMDTAILKKATQPFFSARPAGRKRGMGLAYAARFIQLNAGTLGISSELGSGTTVTIHLPCT